MSRSRALKTGSLASRPSRHLPAVAALIVLATFVAYLPVVRGGFLWDDDAHVTKPELRSLSGLYRIWFKVGATQQYYPLLHSAFWIEHQLWGDQVIGYHLVNIALHAGAAVLVMFILRRLLMEKKVSWADPAAFLTAAVFALHPVHVESVAWITEQKNTLSAVFYLAAMMTYLRFDRTRRRGLYLWATALFIAGLLTKTVTASLPAALLVIFWWQRGKLPWKRDVIPLIPWLALGLIGGLFTAWVEHDLIGAKGQAFELSATQRFLLAGRVVWFYLSKLFWPADLIFIYPRWTVDPASWRQWLFPLGLIAFFMGLLILAKKRRAPLAALLFFVGSLLPVLGFFNVFPFIYSFVANHFQYLASLGVIALTCSGIVVGVSKIQARAAREALLYALPLILGVLTFRECGMYADLENLFETTIQKNPACWMAYNNLGVVIEDKGRREKAIEYYRRALQLRPNYAEAHNNLGAAFYALGRYEEAIACHQEAFRLRPDFAQASYNLGIVLDAIGKPEQAIAAYQEALRVKPDYAKALDNMAVALMNLNRLSEAIDRLSQAKRLDPGNPRTRINLGIALGRSGRHGDAAAEFKEVIRMWPGLLEPQWDLAVAYDAMGRFSEAMAAVQRARELANATRDTTMIERIDAWIAECRTRAQNGAPHRKEKGREPN